MSAFSWFYDSTGAEDLTLLPQQAQSESETIFPNQKPIAESGGKRKTRRSGFSRYFQIVQRTGLFRSIICQFASSPVLSVSVPLDDS